MRYKILVVDDEKDIVELLRYNLEKENIFEVFTAYKGRDALNIIKKIKPDLVILDIMMPEYNGYEICKELLSTPSTSFIPVVFLTAKDNEIDEIIGLELGAYDYIHKPVSPKKIIARVKSILRRVYANSDTFIRTNEFIKFKNLEIDLVTHSVIIDNEEIYFTDIEFQLLHLLLLNEGQILSKEILVNQVWENNLYVADRTIDVHIEKVKEKLGDYSEFIETINGFGYRFNSR